MRSTLFNPTGWTAMVLGAGRVVGGVGRAVAEVLTALPL